MGAGEYGLTSDIGGHGGRGGGNTVPLYI